jgi:acetyltransferase-like isoleucine patch superfamily enzyme
VYGDVDLGVGVQLAAPSEINATGSKVTIGDHCDLAAFVVLNVADSSDRCIGRSDEIKRAPIVLGDHVFVGSHAMIGGGVTIGHHSKIAAGTILTGPREIPPYSLVTPSQQRSVHVRAGYYAGGGAS